MAVFFSAESTRQRNGFLPYSNFKTNFVFDQFSLARLPRLRLLEYFFSESFSKTVTLFTFFFLLLVSVKYIDKIFMCLILRNAQSRKILSTFSNLSTILKHKRNTEAEK